MPGGRYPWASRTRSRGESLLGGDALPDILKSWGPETGEALPGSWTFTRASDAYYRDDSGIWQSVGSGVERGGHNIIPGGGGKGYLPEPATTKLSVFRRDLTDASWAKVNITPARNAVGIDGAANSASTLTATAANGTVLQTVTSASDGHSFQAFVARKTGTGTIEITINGGSTWVDITSSLTSSIDNPFTITLTLANPSIGFRIGTSGDEIEVDCVEVEQSDFATSPMIENAGTTTARASDVLLPNLSRPATGYTAFVDATAPPTAPANITVYGTNTGGNFDLASDATGQAKATISSVGVGVLDAAWLGIRLKASLSNANVSGGDVIMSVTGKTSVSGTAGSTNNTPFRISQRSQTDTLQFWRGVMHNLIIYDGAVTQSQNESLVA